MPAWWRADFFVPGRWLGLGGSVLLHGVALAAVMSLEDAWRLGAAPGASVAIPVVWQETAVVPAPAPTPPSLEPPRSAFEAVSRAALPETPPVEIRGAPQLPRPPIARPALRPIPETSGSAPADVGAGEESRPAQMVLDTVATPTAASSAIAAPTASTVAPQPALAAAPAVVGWAVVARTLPTYPTAARRRGAEGEVLLRAEIDTDGVPASVIVLRGSGDPELDAAAVAAVEKWRFRAPGRFMVEIPVVFRIDGR